MEKRYYKYPSLYLAVLHLSRTKAKNNFIESIKSFVKKENGVPPGRIRTGGLRIDRPKRIHNRLDHYPTEGSSCWNELLIVKDV